MNKSSAKNMLDGRWAIRYDGGDMKPKSIEQGDVAFVERKPVPGYEGYYSVTEDGRVWSEDRVVLRQNGRPHSIRGRWRKPGRNSSGYLQVNMSKKGQTFNMLLHRAMAAGFFGLCPVGMEVDHIDQDKDNNHVSNLRYVYKNHNFLNKDSRGVLRNGRGWAARIKFAGHQFNLGTYTTREESLAAYRGAKIVLMSDEHMAAYKHSKDDVQPV